MAAHTWNCSAGQYFVPVGQPHIIVTFARTSRNCGAFAGMKCVGGFNTCTTSPGSSRRKLIASGTPDLSLTGKTHCVSETVLADCCAASGPYAVTLMSRGPSKSSDAGKTD